MEWEEILSLAITPFYQVVVRFPWRENISVLGKLDHGEHMTAETINVMKDATHSNRLFSPEVECLEEIALDILRSS